MMSDDSHKPIDCPSNLASAEGGRIYAMMTGTPEAPRLGYLSEALPVTDDLLALAGNRLPTELFRIAAPCAESACKHFRGGACTLAQRIVDGMEPVVNALPACRIRSTCRWFKQEGGAACVRCPQVATHKAGATEEEWQIGDPDHLEPPNDVQQRID